MSPDHPTNIILIGMPGSGKSTVGIILDKQLAWDFVDTDVVIQSVEGRPLQAIVDNDGYTALRGIEEAVLGDLLVRRHVISTGGSAVYSERAMSHLKSGSLVIFLDIALATVKTRVGDFSLRGISKRPDQSLDELFDERAILYRRYADMTIPCDQLTQEQVCEQIRQRVGAS
jgi:shikimate kinase